MPSEFSICEVATWSEFTAELNALSSETWIYRGQSRDWPLASLLERRLKDWEIDLGKGAGIERQLLREFRRRYRGIDQDDVRQDKLYAFALMQHHGAPTRLLDCTYSRFIAAHNAVKDGIQIDNGGNPVPHVVWCFRGSWLEEQVKKVVGPEKVNARNDDKRRNDDSFDELYLPCKRFVLHDNPLRLNERLSIQQGIFLCPASIETSFHSNLEEMDGVNCKDNMRVLKLKLNRQERIQFIEQLRRMNISSAALFPGLDGFCRSLGEHLVHFFDLAERGAGR